MEEKLRFVYEYERDGGTVQGRKTGGTLRWIRFPGPGSWTGPNKLTDNSGR